MKRLARRQIDGGVHFLVPCGTTGETPTLSDDEKRRVVELVVEEAAGTVPVLAGAGGYDTKEVVHAAQEMQKAGAHGLAVGDAVLQQADAGRPVPALQGHRRRDAAADRALQRARPHRLQHRPGDLRAARDDPERRRREGSVGQHPADGRDLPRGAAATSWCCRATTR